MGNIIGAITLGIVAVVCFIFSYLQFNEKGFLFNNAYLCGNSYCNYCHYICDCIIGYY